MRSISTILISFYTLTAFFLGGTAFDAIAKDSTENKTAQQNFNCAELAREFDYIKESREDGWFRQLTQTSNKDAITFDFNLETSFREYLSYTEKLVDSNNPHANRVCNINTPIIEALKSTKLDNKKEIQVKDLIAPFQLQHANNKKVILLIHGLTDSPFHFHDLAGYFFQQGFDVRTMLMPGHGTAPEGLTQVDFYEWREATAYVIGRTLLDYDEVYLGGFSTGGALIYDYLINRQYSAKRIQALFMWAPASKAKSDLAWLAEYINYLPFLTYLNKSADIDFAKYESFPVNAAAQVNSLMSSINEDADSSKFEYHNIPVFWVASEADTTINTDSTLALASSWHNPAQRGKTANDVFLYYGDVEHAKNKLPETISVISPDCLLGEECKKLADIAHTAMINAPSNPHYGMDGNYRSCEHYADNEMEFQDCKQSEVITEGEITQANLKAYQPLKRLTYNPYFEHMTKTLSQFLKSIEAH